MTSQRLTGYAQRKGYPFLCVHAGKKSELRQDGSVTYLSLKRSPASFKLDEDLAYDPLFQRHTNRVLRALLDFKPDVIHITGLNDVSIAVRIWRGTPDPASRLVAYEHSRIRAHRRLKCFGSCRTGSF